VDSLSLASIPDTREALRKYNVVILGDCDPKHPRLKNHLKNLADYARLDRGSVVFLAGTSYNPNRYKGTPLEDILPVEPVGDGPPAEMPLKEAFRPNLTLAGRAHPIFRFDPDEETRMKVWTRLTPIYWCATGYRSKRDAAILAVHPALKGIDAGEHPLVVHRKVGTGQALFVGFDETWRWRLREDAAQFNRFWLQTLRYLAKPMPVGNWLWVDQDTPYVIGDPIRIRARLPQPLADKRGPVKVSVHFTAPWAKEATRSALTLIPAAPDANEFVATITRAREGTYRFVLTDPELADIEAQGVPPSAEAIVELPVGESKNFGVNMNHLREAADPSRGIVFTLGNAGQFLEMLPAQQ
jgi:uncharacterized membrane protein